MHPILIDLSRFSPFGLDLRSWMWDHRWPMTLVIVGILAVLGVLQSRTQSRKGGRGSEILSILSMLVLALIVAVAVMSFAKINSYGLMMAIGFMVAILIGRWRIRRLGENPDMATTLGMLSLVAGVVGARVSYVIEHWQDFAAGYGADGVPRGEMDKLIEAAKLTSGGLVFDGGLILAVVVVLAYLWFKKLPIRRFLDVLAICAMVGLAFGRVGCLLNGCCFGGVCKESFPLAIHFPYSAPPLIYPHEGENPYSAGSVPSPVYSHQVERGELKSVPPELVAGRNPIGQVELKMPDQLVTPQSIAAATHAHSLAVQPAQAYGIVNALLIAALLTAFFRLRKYDGQVFTLLLVLYPISRFVLEMIRDDNAGMALTPAQVKCLFFLAAGLLMLVLMGRLPASSGPTWSQRAALATEHAQGHVGKKVRHKR